jgi:hypothetical protein
MITPRAANRPHSGPCAGCGPFFEPAAMINELRLARCDHCLIELQRILRGQRIILVRYTRTHLVALYQ